MTKQELDILLDELKSDVARMRRTPLDVAMATDVFWAVDPLPLNGEYGIDYGKGYESSTAFDEAREDRIERSRRLRRPE